MLTTPLILRRNARRIVLGTACVLFSGPAWAGTIAKTNNTDNLNLGSSWVGGVVPGSADVASWDNTVTAANAVNLGADTSWAGLSVANPGGAVTINGANTLTLGTSGIDLSSATVDLTLNCR